MKKFAFKLQKLLDLREFEENQAKIELGKAVSNVELLNQSLRNIAQKRVQAQQSQKDYTAINDLMTIQHYIAGLDSQKEDLLEKLAAAELVLEEKRTIFAEKMKNRKVLSKLYEKQFAEYKKEYLREEDKILDDIVNRDVEE